VDVSGWPGPGRWRRPEWQIQPVPAPSGAPGTFFAGVSCTSPSFCAAVGARTDSAGNPVGTLAERWNGMTWTIQPTPVLSAGQGSFFSGVACQATACTAVGLNLPNSGPRMLAERWNGASWQIQPMPTPQSRRTSTLPPWHAPPSPRARPPVVTQPLAPRSPWLSSGTAPAAAPSPPPADWWRRAARPPRALAPCPSSHRPLGSEPRPQPGTGRKRKPSPPTPAQRGHPRFSGAERGDAHRPREPGTSLQPPYAHQTSGQADGGAGPGQAPGRHANRQTRARAQFWSHARPQPFTAGHPERVRAAHGRCRFPANTDQQRWKACWGQPFRSSNLASCATLTSRNT
jgi:hypothetical protein